MTDYQNFTSLSPELERQFVPFERRAVESGKKAWTIGLAAAACFGVFLILVVFSFDPPKDKFEDDPGSFGADISEESATPADQAAATAPTDEAAATDDEAATGDEAASGDEASGDEASGDEAADEGATKTEAPPPPKGAKKAPPTALINH